MRSSYAAYASSQSVIASSNGRRKDLVPSCGAFILHVTPIAGVDTEGVLAMTIVGIVMLSSVALFILQQFDPQV
jgi:hypothetical protein